MSGSADVPLAPSAVVRDSRTPITEELAGRVAVDPVDGGTESADRLLICIIVLACAMTGWRPGRAWLLLLTGGLVRVVGDSVYQYAFTRAATAPVPRSTEGDVALLG